MVHNMKQLAQKVKFTYKMEEFLKNVPSERGKQTKDIQGHIHSPQCLRWFRNYEIIKVVGKADGGDHNKIWVQGPNWKPVIEKLNNW